MERDGHTVKKTKEFGSGWTRINRVDDLEGNCIPELLSPIQTALEAVYGPLKRQEREYKHVGIDRWQSKALDVIQWSQKRFALSQGFIGFRCLTVTRR